MPDLHPLSVVADLDLSVDGEEVSIDAEGDVIVVQVPSARAGARLLQSGPFAAGQRGKRLRQTSRMLRAVGLTLEVRVEGDVVARLGKDARAGSLARLLQLRNVEMRPGHVFRRTLRSSVWEWSVAAGITGLVLAGLYWWRRR